MPELKHPSALALLVVPVALALALWLRRHARPALAVSSGLLYRALRGSLRTRLSGVPRLLRLSALVLLVLVVARPRHGERWQEAVTQGIDLMVALDVSGSMRAEDLRPRNRLEVAKDLVTRFVDTREHDRLGLVVFAGKSYTACPLTADYALLKSLIDSISFDSVDEDGTAIGMALGTAVNRLRQSTAASRVVILVTDGVSNRGVIDPLTAAALAEKAGVRVYTVGVGTRDSVPMPAGVGSQGTSYIYQKTPLDERTLETIAERTGGYYFRATDRESLAQALARIGELETSPIETLQHVTYDELFAPFLATGLLLLLGEGFLAATWLRRLP